MALFGSNNLKIREIVPSSLLCRQLKFRQVKTWPPIARPAGSNRGHGKSRLPKRPADRGAPEDSHGLMPHAPDSYKFYLDLPKLKTRVKQLNFIRAGSYLHPASAGAFQWFGGCRNPLKGDNKCIDLKIGRCYRNLLKLGRDGRVV